MVEVRELNGEEYLFIKGNVPSLKNSKIKTARGIFASKTVGKYIRSMGIQSYSVSKKEVKGYVNRPNEFIKAKEYFDKYLKNKPYEIGFHFVRNSKRSFDFNNANQILADLMTANNIIEDDDMDHFLPYPLKINDKAYTINKDDPGVYIKILN
jgi:5-bromo-4-chloroindolyl phosphate hydrolysis protein